MSTATLTGSPLQNCIVDHHFAVHAPHPQINPLLQEIGNLRARIIQLERETEEPLARLADIENTQRQNRIIEESKTSIPALTGEAVSAALSGIPVLGAAAAFVVRRASDAIQHRAISVRAWKRFGPTELAVIQYRREHLGMSKEQALIELLRQEMRNKRVPLITPSPESIGRYLEEHPQESRDMALREIVKAHVHDWVSSSYRSLPSDQTVADYKRENGQLSTEAALLELIRLKLELHQVPFVAPSQAAINRYVDQNRNASRQSAIRSLVMANILEWERQSRMPEEETETPSFGDSIGMPDASFDISSGPDFSSCEIGGW